MKRYLMLLLIIAILLIGCSQNRKNNSTESAEVPSKKEIFDKFVDEKDLESYILKVNNEEIFNAQSDEKKYTAISEGSLEMIKEPLIYHTKWQDDGDKKNERESYVIDKEFFYRENNGNWNKQPVEEEVKNDEEKTYFVGKTIISSSTILKLLESYYELTESEDTYIAKLDSGSDNIDEIKNIIFGKDKNSSFFGELISLKAQYSFKKDNYYPISFEWKAKFLNKDNNEVMEIKQTGNYEQINKLENIEIPQEVKSLLNSDL
ncbi:hypothetical protein ING2D1G_0089 [Peptoniphilus sp. ING2-D1G]|nr:hypothetical protein ING2D1G_0089 [Peptoniphilus sp. ING2-D1G]